MVAGHNTANWGTEASSGRGWRPGQWAEQIESTGNRKTGKKHIWWCRFPFHIKKWRHEEAVHFSSASPEQSLRPSSWESQPTGRPHYNTPSQRAVQGCSEMTWGTKTIPFETIQSMQVGHTSILRQRSSSKAKVFEEINTLQGMKRCLAHQHWAALHIQKSSTWVWLASLNTTIWTIRSFLKRTVYLDTSRDSIFLIIAINR